MLAPRGQGDVMRLVNWLLPLAALATYLVLMLVLAPRVLAETAGMRPFDLRVTGYSADEARTYLAAMTPAGQALYLGWIRIIDTVIPILVMLTLCLPLRHWHWAWTLPALAFAALDLAENSAVARLIRTGAQVDDASVALASALTMTKFAVLAVAVAVALAGLVSLWRARRRR